MRTAICNGPILAASTPMTVTRHQSDAPDAAAGKNKRRNSLMRELDISSVSQPPHVSSWSLLILQA
jgi:hypothetical protein